MIIPLGERYQQAFHLLQKKNGRLVGEKLIPTLFVPMTGLSEERRKVQPDPKNPRLANSGFEADENDDGLADSWHYQRQTALSSEDAIAGRRYLVMYNESPGRFAQALQGTAVDGKAIGQLRVSFWAKHEDVRFGIDPRDQPALMIHFYDVTRKTINTAMIGPFRGSVGWQRMRRTIPVPAKAREMVVRVGLNGGTGTLCVDEIVMEPLRR